MVNFTFYVKFRYHFRIVFCQNSIKYKNLLKSTRRLFYAFFKPILLACI